VTPASFPFYTTGEDNLRLTSWNSAAGVRLKLNGRTIDNSGQAKADSWDQTPNTDRSAKSDDLSLSGCTILNLTVFAAAGAPQIGQTFVKVELIRGIGVAAIVLGTILQGYVTTNQAIGFPGSPIQNTTDAQPAVRLITGTTPAPGSEINEVVPTGARWQLVYFQAKLTTGATAGTRGPRLAFNTGTPAFIHFPASSGLAPSLNKFFAWTTNGLIGSDTSSNVSSGNIPDAAILTAGQSIATNTENLIAGDAWSNVTYGIEERLEIG
jgi:hypothetical protein